MEDTIIKGGDFVSVNINSAQITLCYRAKVLYVPCQVDDYWVFRNLDTNEILHTNEKLTVIKLKE